MTCQDALALLLDADLASDIPGEEPALRDHVAGCSRCARVARQLRTDSTRLAQAIVADRAAARVADVPAAARLGRLRWQSRWRPRWRVMAPALATATAALLLTWLPGPSGGVSAPDRRSVASVASVVSAVSVAPTASAPRRATARRAAASDRRSPPVAMQVEPFVATRVSVEPFRDVTPSTMAAPEEGGVALVTVDPAPGLRSIVSHTSNPRITVVWLY